MNAGAFERPSPTIPAPAGERIGVMVCGHGSRSEAAVAEFAALAGRLAERFPAWPVEYGYLEFANPVIRDGLDRLRAAGVDRVLAVPGMLFAASHAKNDIPSVLATYQAAHGLKIDYGRDLGVDARMVRAAGERIQNALDDLNARLGPAPNSEVCLVVIGRGASDPDANANVAKVARLLWEGFGFGWCETGYSGVTFPLVEPCLERVTRLGFSRVVVFPYFLFTGILVDRIYGFTDRVAARHPGIAFARAGYLADHPLVVDTFAERVTEILTGDTAMNCGLCKYRIQVLGFETEVGLPQESHHHHVEGKGAAAPGSTVADCALCEDFCTGACRVLGGDGQAHGADRAGDAHHGAGHGHSHDGEHAHGHHGGHAHDDQRLHRHAHHDGHGEGHHHHHPYPHAAHPLGPLSVLDPPPPAAAAAPGLAYERDPDAIYRASFAAIRADVDLSRFSQDEARIAERVVHACAIPGVADDLRFCGPVARAARAAIAAGRPILADSRMTAAAIRQRRLPERTEIVCRIDDEETRALAAQLSTTRSAAAVHLWRDRLEGAVVVIGNAPTALFELLALLREGAPPPAAIFAFPVGFVGAAESKAALVACACGIPYVTLLGRRGGSAMAGAAVNAALADATP